jgi:prevent-host-death family protein
MEVNIHEAKTHFSRLIQRVAAGEEITIARAGKPVARLVAVETKTRPLGFAREEIWIADDFDAPLPDDLLKEFYGGELPALEPSKPDPKSQRPASKRRRVKSR